MVGMFLKDREVQYTANRDEVTNTWRILDTWHEDLVNLGPDDEVPDDSSAVLILTEGSFIALVKEAARLGYYKTPLWRKSRRSARIIRRK